MLYPKCWVGWFRLSLIWLHIYEDRVSHDAALACYYRKLNVPINLSRMLVEVLLKGVTPTIGEGPHWNDKTQSLFFVDVISHTVYIWDSNTGKLESKTLGKYSMIPYVWVWYTCILLLLPNKLTNQSYFKQQLSIDRSTLPSKMWSFCNLKQIQPIIGCNSV